MDMHALATHARSYIESEYHATVSDMDAVLVASMAANYVANRDGSVSAVEFVKETLLRGKPPLEDAFFYLVMDVL